MNPPKFIIFIHVPKTAGTAVARLFEKTYPGRLLYDYGTERDMTEARTPSPLALYNRESIRTHFRMIYGHFHHIKYAELFYDADFLSLVRDPVSRAVSHYYHLARYNDPAPHPIAERVKSGNLDIVELHRSQPPLRNVLGLYFEGRAVSDFSYILTQEKLAASVEACAAKLRIPELTEMLASEGGVEDCNSRPKVPLPETVRPVTEEHLNQLEDILAGERMIYNAVLKAFPC
jgi:hypothetical protein